MKELISVHRIFQFSMMLAVQSTKKELCNVANELGIKKVIVALKDRRGSFPTAELIRCRTAGIEILEGNTFYEMLCF